MAKPTAPPRLSYSSVVVVVTCVLVGLLCFFAPSALAHSSPHPISDNEISSRKNVCYADIENGLWGRRCRSPEIAKENCALRCVSPACYELIYESDPLEEGERDYVRSQEYRYCMRRFSVGLGLDSVKGTFDADLYVRTPSMSLPGSMRIGTIRKA